MGLDPALRRLWIAGYSTGDKTSFAYTSARERWPIIIARPLPLGVSLHLAPSDRRPLLQTQAIDDVYRSVAQTDDATKTTEGRSIINELAQLKYQVQHDRQLT